MDVMDSGILSGFIAGPPDSRDIPNGGPMVRKLEEEWQLRYGVKHALSFNSATTALMAACKAVGVERGDHVICPPWTMSATPAAAIHCGAVIDFADIEPDTFCIDPERVLDIMERREVQAVMAVNLFGHPAELEWLKEICGSRGVSLIEDAAQTPLATEDGKRSGTVGDIGVYSLNRHKHIHCGEGGIAVTDDDELAAKMRSVRNHGVDPLGLNLRMTELEAAVAYTQLKDIDRHVNARIKFAHELNEALPIEPFVRPGCTHDYYMWVVKHDGSGLEEVPHIKGYIQPLHKIFTGGYADCPVVEEMRNEIICFETCKWAPTDDQFHKLVGKLDAAFR
jgi:perosamine synthetase